MPSPNRQPLLPTLMHLRIQLQHIPDPRGRILSDASRIAFADVAGKLGDLFEEYIPELRMVVVDVRPLWTALLPWALLILLRYVVLLQSTEGVPHHLLLSSEDVDLISPLLHLLAQLATIENIREAMAQSSVFVAILTKAWMMLFPHKDLRLYITLTASLVGNRNEFRHLAAIASFTPNLSLALLESIMHEFSPGREVDYVHLDRVMWSMAWIVCASPKGCIFCSSLAVRWVFGFA
ncbi:hypothetical protein EV421DRAFT_1736135 [Armillaria borealis]|uniref:Uncharacterized protein n=1 Tax=Armillaria borealis TaxID=47425 RepID=A0AA39MPS7_9AGAR|nr:hypothetical protein EV421DRAFT_1736135 [Armillaria borealis]